MKCSCYCTARNYRIRPLLKFLRENNSEVKFYRDAIHVKKTEGNVFYFAYGCLICWGLSEETEKELIAQVQGFADEPLAVLTYENFNYQPGDMTGVSPENDVLVVATADPLIMLAVSFALAQSIKLVNYEEAVDRTIKETAYLPQELATKGKIKLSRKAISRYMGNLFLVRNSINLRTDFLGAPEFFWEYPRFESDYVKAATYLEIQKRVEILNKRLDVIHELFDMLSNELRHQYSSILEQIIILLIAVEIVLWMIYEVVRH